MIIKQNKIPTLYIQLKTSTVGTHTTNTRTRSLLGVRFFFFIRSDLCEKMGRKMEYLAMKTDHPAPTQSMNSDMNELKIAAKRLINDATKVGGLGFGTSFLEWVSSFAAIGEFGKWVTFIAVVLRLFFPRYFPDWLEMPGSLILLLVVAPNFFAHTLRENWVGVFICLIIGCYLLQEHIRASGGFRNSFTQTNGISNTLGIILLLVYPIWALVVDFI
ncbi:hypothetical protein TEA_019745 [Camellia sinensis var. sinensis]|uniref:Uncharacterized protein n=1 Tax=Camellia sinensis var. sinensis TaxID=542762 RepID=A0A4S4ES63_CAMSN|nr:hypothetical protein TEA_019745 [Camellia sinensis var. sinensis]